MTQRFLSSVVGAALIGAVSLSCEPSSITEARDQLGRGSNDTFSLQIPLVSDTFFVSTLVPEQDTVTLAGGVLGIRIQSDSVVVNVGADLRFDNIVLDQFRFSFDEMLQTEAVSTNVAVPLTPPPPPGPAGVNLVGTPRDTLNFLTPGGSNVQAATVDAGWAVRTITNNTTCDATVTMAVLDDASAAFLTFPDTVVLAGTTLVDSASAAGATMSGFVDIATTAVILPCVPAFAATVSSDITFRPMTLSSVDLTNVDEGYSENYGALDSETRIQAVDTIVGASGSLSFTFQNRLPMPLTIDMTLNGILDPAGVPLRDSTVVPAAPGDGSTTLAVLAFDLTGAAVVTGAVVANVVGRAVSAAATVTRLAATDATIVDGTGSIVSERLAGTLDPAQTPELTVPVEEFTVIDASAVVFEDLEDAMLQSTINLAIMDLVVTNDANVPLLLDGLTLGVVQLDASGAINRDGSGNPDYETDASGPLLANVADSGQTTLTVAPLGTDTVSINSAPLIDRVVKLALGGTSAALVTVGNVVAGDGVTPGSISRTDRVGVQFDVAVGLDFTLPVGGIQFDVNEVSDGIGLDSAEANDLATRVVEVGGTAFAENFTPFGVEVTVAIAPDSLADTLDVFVQPGAIFLDTLALTAPTVNALGIPQGSTADSVALTITGPQSRVLFGSFFTAGIRVRLLAGTGGGGRGAIRTGDMIVIGAAALIRVRRGGQ